MTIKGHPPRATSTLTAQKLEHQLEAPVVVILKVTDWTELSKPLRNLYSREGRKGSAVEQAFKMLFLQFLEDRSDRQDEQQKC